MSEDDVQRIMRLPWVAIASDGAALRKEGVLGQGLPHPRSFGTNPRVPRKYVREEKALTLEDAVRTMTSFPAQILRLADRGLLREGYWADVVVFDPEHIIDNATYDDPKQFPTGIPFVVVNGQVAVDNERCTGVLAGHAVP